MDNGREEIIKIKEVLKKHPKGLSLSDISKLVGMNRHSIAKYMEMLTISGHVEMHSFGPSKVYYLSQRVPIAAMLSFSSDIIGTIDRDMKLIQVNDALLKFFNFQREDLVGQHISRLDKILPVSNGMMKLLRDTLDGQMHQYNARVNREGEICYLRMKLIPAAFDDGTAGVVFIAEDVTAEKWAEMALRESESRYRAVVEEQTELIVRILPDTTITFVNDAWCRFFGDEQSRVLGKKMIDLMPGEYREPYLTDLHSIKPDQPQFSIEKPIITEGAGERWMLWMYRGVFREEQLVEVQVIARDVTDRKKAELALEAANLELEKKVTERTADLTKSNNMIQTVLDTVPNPVLVVDAGTQRITYVSPPSWNFNGKGLIGMTMDTVLGHLNLFKSDGTPMGDDEVPMLRTLQKGESVKNDECILRYRGVEMVMLVSSAPVYGPDGRITAAVSTMTDITERKRSEEAIRESRERFKAVFDRAAVGIAIANPDGYMIDSNAIYQEMLGYTKEELQQKRIYDITYTEDVNKCLDLERQLYDGSIDKYLIEKRYVRKDGRIIRGKLNVSAIRNSDGSLKYNLGVMDDVTERRRAEEALQDSEVRFRSLIHNSTDIIRILDGDGRIIFDSPSSERILGYPTGYTLGKSPFDFIHPDDREKVSRDLDTVYNKKNNAIPTEYRMRKADGEYLEVESLGMNMIGVLGVDGIVINTRPIAERKRAEEALRESEANLKMAEKIACLGQWDIDMATGEGHWSDGTYRLLGYRPGEIETGGDAWMARIHPDDRSYVEDCKRAALQNKQSLAYDYRIVLPDGEVRWIHDESNAPVLDAAGRPVKVFGTVQDITERKLTEKQLAETARFLKAALRASPLAITAIDRNMNVILWNKMAENVFGWTEEEVLGKPLPTVPEDLKDEGDKLHALVNSGESLHGIATRRRRKDGAVIDLTIDASPLYDENGKLLGALGVFQELKP